MCPEKTVKLLGNDYEMHDARHRFSKEDTDLLLQEAKRLHLTITQVAMATFFLPMLRRLPAAETDQLSYALPINSRDSLETAASLYYGNAVAHQFGEISCSSSTLTANLRRGVLEDDEDARKVLLLANTLKERMEDFQRCPLDHLTAWYKETETKLSRESALPPSRETPRMRTGFVADGKLDRYIQQGYMSRSKETDLRVLDVHVRCYDPSPLLNPRISTFANRLSVSYSFNEGAWQGDEVQVMVEEWADGMKYILLRQNTP
jgi:hypothetical protein